jgi:uncharacterized protein (DUF58 family)
VLPTTLLLDASSSMAFPLATHAKWQQARQLAIGLAAVAHAGGDPVGVAVHDDMGGMRILPPRTRRSVVSEIARVIDAAEPDGTEPLAPTLAALRSPRIAIITDLLGDADELLRAASVHVVGGGEVHLVHIVAREELNPPRRALLAADPEAPSLQRLLVDSTRRTYLEAFGEWRASMARRWRAAGASYVEVATDEEPARAVRRIVEPPALVMSGARA